MRADAKETRRRPPPAAASRRKPQTGLPPGQERRRGPVVSGRLAYLVQIYDQGELEGLVAQELAVWRRSLDAQPRRNGPPIGLLPSPLTAAVRLRPDSDPALRLDAASLRRCFPDQAIRFDAEQPAVAVSTEFLGQRTDLPPMGFIPVSQSGDIVIGWVNLARVMAFAEHRAVVRIDALRVLAPTGGGGSASADGLGVRIACVDMGFDFEHPGLLQDVGGMSTSVRSLCTTWSWPRSQRHPRGRYQEGGSLKASCRPPSSGTMAPLSRFAPHPML